MRSKIQATNEIILIPQHTLLKQRKLLQENRLPPRLASLDILRTTRTITLNAAANLTLAPASLSTSETLTLAPTASTYDAPTERATFAFAQDLPAGSKATLSVGFSAPLDGSMTGYYASKWDKGVYALTQFEVGPPPLPCLKFYVC